MYGEIWEKRNVASSIIISENSNNNQLESESIIIWNNIQL